MERTKKSRMTRLKPTTFNFPKDGNENNDMVTNMENEIMDWKGEIIIAGKKKEWGKKNK